MTNHLFGHPPESRITTLVSDIGAKVRLTCTMNDSAVGITGHRWMKGDKVLSEDMLSDLRTDYEVDSADRPGEYSCIFLPEHAGRANIQVSGVPKIKAVKSSENADEGDKVVLVCKSDSFPPVLNWWWHKMNESGDQVKPCQPGQRAAEPRLGPREALPKAVGTGDVPQPAPLNTPPPQVITNSSQGDKYFVVSSDVRSELHILKLDVDEDAGKYSCSANNTEGQGQDVITLRVRRHLAALWPFLGIVAEVLVLVTIIFIYEKRRKPDEVLDGEPAPRALCLLLEGNPQGPSHYCPGVGS
ncbi:Basigin [Galemys pyrenaicus]|uniref:Basigin n=1 Tax=Galemys pyrenaicus TaxID=202257 RepID=A0A8J6DRH5_GALPY|nr:Basigin [Galemys pyrenaicus]